MNIGHGEIGGVAGDESEVVKFGGGGEVAVEEMSAGVFERLFAVLGSQLGDFHVYIEDMGNVNYMLKVLNIGR